MIHRILAGTTIAILFLSATARADELACVNARYAAWSQFVKCEGKAFASTSDVPFQKCRSRYQAIWPKLQAKFPGTSCALPRFVDNGATITDNLTQLVWEKKDGSDGTANPANHHDVDNLYTWSQASAAADGTVFTSFLKDLNSTCFDGDCDWRLPGLLELQTILEPGCQSDPCVDPLFLPTRIGIVVYWTSLTTQVNPSLGWLVAFHGGNSGSLGKASSAAARAVRGGL